MPTIPVFQCCSCGQCCSNIRGFTSASERGFLEEFGKGKLPLIQLSNIDEMTFPLWDWEAKRFLEHEKEVAVNAHITPSRGVMDLQSGKFIVFTYQMNTPNRCPFLSENGKCTIYHTPRAHICHLFPLNRTPYLKVGDDNYRGIFGECHTLNTFKDQFSYDDRKKLLGELYESFGEGFLHALQHDYLMEWSNKIIIEMMKSEMIKPAVNYPVQFLMKRVENTEKIDLSTFLVESGYKTQEDVDEVIRRSNDLEDAKDILREEGIIS